MKGIYFKVYGAEGHRQRESFNKSELYDFSTENETRVLMIKNADKTGTNDYTVVGIIRDTAEEVLDELCGQITDGIFENSRTGKIEMQVDDDCWTEINPWLEANRLRKGA